MWCRPDPSNGYLGCDTRMDKDEAGRPVSLLDWCSANKEAA
jgi:hypothetical protein